jgi:hypothetical protein
LVDRSRPPHAPVRKMWLPLMVQVYHLQKVHPDTAEFQIWSLLAGSDVSVRTIGRGMALNQWLYDDIPHVPTRGAKQAPGLHPYKASHRHQYWFMDGRRMDFGLDGVWWWSLIMLEGYSRTMLAGAMAPTEATWVALVGTSSASYFALSREFVVWPDQYFSKRNKAHVATTTAKSILEKSSRNGARLCCQPACAIVDCPSLGRCPAGSCTGRYANRCITERRGCHDGSGAAA